MEDQTLLQNTQARLARRGLNIPHQPPAEPEWPEDITVIPRVELMRLMNHYTARTSYARSQLAEADVTVAGKRHLYKVKRAERYLELKNQPTTSGKPPSIPELDALLEVDQQLAPLRGNEVGAEAYQTYVRALLSGYEGRYNLLSRELTSRGMAAEKEN